MVFGQSGFQKAKLIFEISRTHHCKNNLQEIIVEIEIPQALVYEDIVLISLSNFKAAYSHLQKVEYFQGIERRPLKPEEVSRMLGAK